MQGILIGDVRSGTGKWGQLLLNHVDPEWVGMVPFMVITLRPGSLLQEVLAALSVCGLAEGSAPDRACLRQFARALLLHFLSFSSWTR